MYNQKAVSKYYRSLKNKPELLAKKRARTKLYQELNRFGRPRIEIIEYFNYTCQKCFVVYKDTPERFDIDHIDNQGRNVEKPNNDFSNFNLLCSSCHAKKTWQERHKFLRKNRLFPNHWKKLYGHKLKTLLP